MISMLAKLSSTGRTSRAKTGTGGGGGFTRGFVTTATLAAVILGSLVALAPVRRAHAGSDEASGEFGGEAEKEKPKGDKPYALQATDPDAPQDPAVVAAKKKAAADAALVKQQKKDEGPPVYQKWQFWALTGAVVVAVVGIIIGGSYVLHSMNGGDVAQCPSTYAGCFGEGR
jgi:hypothetical protein